MNFDITALTESRIKKNSVFPINIELGNYSIEQTPAEIAAGGALLYISKRLPIKIISIFICLANLNLF